MAKTEARVQPVEDEAQPGRWWPSQFGPDDQLGMLNHITDARRAAALGLVRQGRLFDLGHVLHEGIPVFPGRYFRQTLVTTAHHANSAEGQMVGDNGDLEPQPGDAVLFHTGWSRHWEDAETYLSGEPGPGLQLACWLAEQGVALTGCDTWSFGPVPAEKPKRPFEVPQTLNARHGVFVVENLATAELASAGVREFALILTHPKLQGATGSWTSPIALI